MKKQIADLTDDEANLLICVAKGWFPVVDVINTPNLWWLIAEKIISTASATIGALTFSTVQRRWYCSNRDADVSADSPGRAVVLCALVIANPSGEVEVP